LKYIIGVFKKINTKILKAEAATPFIYLIFNKLQNQIITRLYRSEIADEIRIACEKIKNILNIHNTKRRAIRPESSGCISDSAEALIAILIPDFAEALIAALISQKLWLFNSYIGR